MKERDLVEDQDDEVLIINAGISYRRIIVQVNIIPIVSIDFLQLTLSLKFCQIWPYLFSITFVYIVTLSLFPAVSVLIRSASYGHGYVWNGMY